jgi:hypothetical protein
MPLKKEVNKILEVDSLAASAKTDLKDCDLIDLKETEFLAVTIQVKHGASATKAVLVHIVSDTDGGSPDTTDYASFESHLDPGKLSQKTIAVAPDPRYMRIYLENQDTSCAATDIKVWVTLGYKE